MTERRDDTGDKDPIEAEFEEQGPEDKREAPADSALPDQDNEQERRND